MSHHGHGWGFVGIGVGCVMSVISTWLNNNPWLQASVLGFGILCIIAGALFFICIPSEWMITTPTALLRLKFIDSLVFRPLPEVMRRLHEATLDSGVAEFERGFGAGADDVLDRYAYCAMELGLPIFGCRPASSIRELIPLSDHRQGTIKGGASRLVPEIGTGGTQYTDLAVKRSGLRRRWRKLVAEIKSGDH